MTDTTMAPAPPAGLRVGQVFGRAFAIFFGDFFKFFLLTAVMWLPYLAFLAMARHPTGFSGGPALALSVVFWLVLNVIAQAVVLYGAIQKMRGQDFAIVESLRRGFARFFPILGLIFCDGLGCGLASLLLIVPGAILWTMWIVGLPACVAEGLGPIESLKRSGYLTKGNRWRVFAVFLVFFLVNFFVQVILQLLLAKIAGVPGVLAGTFLWTVLVQALYAILIAVVYHDLRVAREGVDTERIAAVFD
ncbi:MAG TPA: hypothetical protein VE397_22760 [Stellaceae bacterium]|jgi:hypothetical protein|nr:hypothetical protein [Stellaceae bacterium]